MDKRVDLPDDNTFRYLVPEDIVIGYAEEKNEFRTAREIERKRLIDKAKMRSMRLGVERVETKTTE